MGRGGLERRVRAGDDELSVRERNVIRRLFIDPASPELNPDWERVARGAVGVLRGAAAKMPSIVLPFVDELASESPRFDAFWREHEIQGLDEGERRLRHAVVGEIAFDFNSFSVDGRSDLVLLVHTPTTAMDKAKVLSLLG